MSGLQHRVSMRDERPRFPQAETQLAKQPLALAHTERHAVPLVDERGQGLAIPQPGQPDRLGRAPKRPTHALQVGFGQPPRAALAGAFGQRRQAGVFEPAHPIFDGPRRIAQQLGDLRTGHALRDQQHAVQPVVVPRLAGSANLVLQPRDDLGCLRNRESVHAAIRPEPPSMRNYLCRPV